MTITGSEGDTFDTTTPPPAPCYNVTLHHWFNETIDVVNDAECKRSS